MDKNEFIHHATVWVLGLLTAFMLYGSFVYLQWEYQTYKPISWIFEASLTIPDFKAGTNPMIDYKRTIHEDFRATPLIEIKDIDNQTVCREDRNKTFSYEAGEPLSPEDRNLKWFMIGASCLDTLKPGHYYIQTDWNIMRPNMPVRNFRLRTNIFEVFA